METKGIRICPCSPLIINKENIVLGKISNLMETGANDVLMIKGEHGQILIPFVSNYIESVDTDSKTIIADWGSPAGCRYIRYWRQF